MKRSKIEQLGVGVILIASTVTLMHTGGEATASLAQGFIPRNTPIEEQAKLVYPARLIGGLLGLQTMALTVLATECLIERLK